MKAVIIEDEKRAATHLKNLLGEVAADIQIIAQLQSVNQSVRWFRENPLPDLVFLDIHLADGSSFEIFKETEIKCPIIFTTAYEEYALKAFEVNSIDYLLKPLCKEDLTRALSKIKSRTLAEGLQLNDPMILNQLLEALGREPIYKKALLVQYKDKLIPLTTKDIAYFYTEFKMTKAVTFSNISYTIDNTLESLLLQLSPKDFFRINRQYIISRNAVKDAAIWFSGRLSLNLIVPTPEKLIVSRSNSSEFKQWLTN